MDSPARPVTPLRQRMLEDMRMRKMADDTQHAYILAVRKLAAFLRRSPDTADAVIRPVLTAPASGSTPTPRRSRCCASSRCAQAFESP
jgi:hypothetical protein